MLDVRRLRLLRELAARRTVTAVAEALSYTPSAVSQQLAALERDAGVPLTGDVLLAVADGRAVAAMSVADGRVAADPFARTGEAVALLRLRAQQARRRSGAPRRLGLGRLGVAA